MLQIITIKERVSQNVFLAVSSFSTAFLIIVTKFKQKIIQNIGMNTSVISSKKPYNVDFPFFKK
jgi:hypothetical protein